MLKRRRAHKFKGKVLFSSSCRRRVMRKTAHKKTLLRRRTFAIQQMDELEALRTTSSEESI